MTVFSKEDHLYMQRAISLAKRGHYTTSPNPRVGCVLVKNNQVIGEGFHQKAGCGHAEVNALLACRQSKKSPQGATAYVTLEPCSHFGKTPPCTNLILRKRIKKVFYSIKDPDKRSFNKSYKNN